MKIINENNTFQTKSERENKFIKLTPPQSPCSRRESVIFTWFSIFLCSDTLFTTFFSVLFVLCGFQMSVCSIENFTHSPNVNDISEFFISVFISFDRSVKNALCVPLQSFIIFFILLFVVFSRPHYAVEILCVPLLLLASLVDLISFVRFYFSSVVSARAPHFIKILNCLGKKSHFIRFMFV